MHLQQTSKFSKISMMNENCEKTIETLVPPSSRSLSALVVNVGRVGAGLSAMRKAFVQ